MRVLPRLPAALTIPLAIFLVARLVDGVLLAVLGHDQAAYADLVTAWDGGWYREIAEHGYPDVLPRTEDGDVAQSALAFYPLYPGLVRATMAVLHLPFPYAAMALSLMCGAAAMCLLFRLLTQTATTFSASMSLLALNTFPTALVFQTAYSESLALLVVVTCLLLLTRRRYGWLALGALVLSLTRPIGLALAPVIVLHAVVRRRAGDPVTRGERWSLAGSVLASVGGFAIWPAVVAVRTGEPTAYLQTQSAWYHDGARTWIATAFSGDVGPAVLGLAAVAALALVLTRRAARAWSPELRGWAVAYAAFLLLTTRPASSAIRLAMLAIIPWWPAPTPADSELSRGAQVTVAVGVTVLGLAASYLWIDWFWIRDDSAIGNP